MQDVRQPLLQPTRHLGVGEQPAGQRFVVGDEGAQVLALASGLANLTTLALGANLISEEGARALAQSPHLANLIALDLGFNQLGPEGAQTRAVPVVGRVPAGAGAGVHRVRVGPAGRPAGGSVAGGSAAGPAAGR